MAESSNGNGSALPEQSSFRWQDHLGLLIGASSVTAIAIRLLAVSDWNSVTAGALFQALGSSDLAFGATLAATPALISSVVFYGLLAHAYISFRYKKPIIHWHTLLATYGAVFLFAAIPIMLALMLALLMVMIIPIARMDAKRDAKLADAENRRFLAFIAANFVFGSFLISNTFWLPNQIMRPTNSQGLLIGAVLEEDDKWTTILQNEPRRIVRIETSKIESRTYCDFAQSWYSRPLLSIREDRQYPPCDEGTEG